MLRAIYNKLAAVIAVGLLSSVTTQGAAVNTLYAFTGGADGAAPASGVIQGSDGNLYGTTPNGGASGFGLIFKMGLSGGVTDVYSFANGSDGGGPGGPLVQATNGNFYGATQSGGANNNGTLYELILPNTIIPFYSFSAGGLDSGSQLVTNSDGVSPVCGLVQGSDGNFYGTASGGGVAGYGTVFKITSGNTFSALYSFTNGADGATPLAGLVQGANGNFYGTTSAGGLNSFGTVFQITPAGQLNAFYSFANGSDGAFPQAPLVRGSGGSLYGVAAGGGVNGNGTIFTISPSGQVAGLYSFGGMSQTIPDTNTDGASPMALALGSDANFYGTASQGGNNETGTLFRITPGGAFTALYSFTALAPAILTNTDGAGPTGLIQANNGIFYGTTSTGGAEGNGTVFDISFTLSLGISLQYSGGQSVIQVSGLNGQGAVVVDASTNLLQWTPIQTNASATGQIQVVDSNAAHYPYRYYRARSQ